MDKFIMAVLSFIIFALLAFLAMRAWRARSIDQSAEFSAPLEALDFFGELLAQAKAFYVSTTNGLNHLERISAYGLGPRGLAQVLVFTEGLLIVRNGERPLALDRAQISEIELTQVAIDKAVEPDGLLSIQWIQDGVNLATQLRIVDTSDRLSITDALKLIIGSKTTREVI